MWGSCFSLGSRRGSAPPPPPPPPPPPHSHSSLHSLIHSLTHSFTHCRDSFLAAFRVAGAVHRASWRSCGARGRRWPAAGCRVVGTVQIASWLPLAWQAQYTEPCCASTVSPETAALPRSHAQGSNQQGMYPNNYRSLLLAPPFSKKMRPLPKKIAKPKMEVSKPEKLT